MQSKIETFEFKSIYPEPTYSVSKNKSWINFGTDNLLPNYIDGLIDNSPVHSSILNGTILLVNGDGFSEPIDPQLKTIFYNENTDLNFDFNSNTMNDILPYLSKDQQTYGAFAINIRWSKDRSIIADYSYVNVSQVRIDSEGNGYWISEDWSNTRKNEPIFIHKFSSDPKVKKEYPSQLIYIKSTNNYKYYSLPKYWSAREVIEADQELDSYNLNRLRNSFMANAVIKYNGVPEKEQKDALYKSLKNFYSGSKNASKTLVLFDNNVEIDKFDGNSTPRDYEWIQKVIYQKIMTGWGVVGKGGLFGLNISDGGVDFSTDSLLNEFTVYSKTVVRPNQKQIEDVFNKIAKINGYKGEEKLEIIPIKLFENQNQIESNLDSNNNIIENPQDFENKIEDYLTDKKIL